MNNCRGQSLVEYAVVLALVSLLAVTLAKGLGRQTVARVAVANEAFQERGVAKELPPIASDMTLSGDSPTNSVGAR